eukprot:UN33230
MLLDQIDEARNELQGDFISKVKGLLTDLVDRTYNEEVTKRDRHIKFETTDEDDEAGREGKPFTNSPDDLFYLLQVQWESAIADYRGQILYDFLCLIPEILDTFRKKIFHDLKRYYLKASTKYLVAHVNNSFKFWEKLNEKREELFEAEDDLSETYQIKSSLWQNLEDKYDDCCDLFVDFRGHTM